MDTQERLERMREARLDSLRRTWPGECPTCFAVPGQRCISMNGKPTRIHWPRAAMREGLGLQDEMATGLETG